MEGVSIANNPKPSHDIGRGPIKAKPRTSRSRTNSPCSIQSTGSTSKAGYNTLSSLANLHKKLVYRSLLVSFIRSLLYDLPYITFFRLTIVSRDNL
jgi:hypothetical protein